MKFKLVFISAFVTLIGTTSYSQLPVLKDTLIKSTQDSANGESKIIYRDITNDEKLPKPLSENEDIPELINFQIDSIEKLEQIANKIFTREEIDQLKERMLILDCKVLPSGKIVSASIVFREKGANICLKKLIHFSQKIKEKLMITPIFSEKTNEEGYLQYYIFAYEVL